MTTADQKYTLALGCLANPFSKQLAAQGLPFNAETMRHLELDAQAASRLKVRGVLGYAAGEKLYDKIAKQVWAEVARAVKAAKSSEAPTPMIDRAEGERSALHARDGLNTDLPHESKSPDHG